MAPEPSRREQDFLRLLTEHKHALFTLIFCIVRSLPDTEDVFQQTAAALWTDFDKFRPEADFLPWAAQIARYRAWNFARSKRREKVFFSESLLEELKEAVRSRFDPADVQEMRLRALAQCRQKLSDADQRVISLCYGGGSIREAAERLGRPVRSVYDSLSRIRRALYECIERTLAREERAL